jgi:preprotein translocase subunit SecG
MAQKYLVPEGASFAYAVAVAALDEQLRRIEALDTKAGILMAVDGVIAGLLFGRTSLLVTAPRLIGVLAVVFVVASLLLALIAFANRRYDLAPQPDSAIRLMAAPEDWLRWRFLGNLQGAISENGRKLTRKSRLLTSALVSLIATVSLLGAYFTYAILAGRLDSI